MIRLHRGSGVACPRNPRLPTRKIVDLACLPRYVWDVALEQKQIRLQPERKQRKVRVGTGESASRLMTSDLRLPTSNGDDRKGAGRLWLKAGINDAASLDRRSRQD
jgi:hypothetical protein